MNKIVVSFWMLALLFAGDIYCQTVIPEKPKVAVTIDDLPLQRLDSFSKEETQTIFDKLIDQIRKQKIPAIGFVIKSKLMVDGKYDSGRINLLKNWLNAGFDLGNHTFSHRSANELPVKEYEEDIVNGDSVLRKVVEESGKELKYFRHPFLHTGLSLNVREQIGSFLKKNGYKVAPVTIDNAEWIFGAAYDKAAKENNSDLMQRIGTEYIRYMNAKFVYYEGRSKELFGREISQVLLIHANKLNSDYFGELCGMIRWRGYNFVNLEEALKDEAYKSKDTFVKNNGISWIDRWAITAGKPKEFFAGEPRTPAYIMKLAGVDSE